MKKFIHLGLLSFILISTSFSANAALLIEPVVGFSSGKYNSAFTLVATGDEDDSSESLRGPSYGGRLGFQNLGFQFGVDYLASSMKLDGAPFKTSELALFTGFEFPVLFRVYAGYILSGKAEAEADDGTKFDFKGGTGPKFGVGCTLFPFVDLNIEYRTVKYDTYEFTNTDGDFELDSDYSAIMVGLSFPLTLF